MYDARTVLSDCSFDGFMRLYPDFRFRFYSGTELLCPRWFTLASISSALVAIFGYWIPLATNPQLLVPVSFALLIATFLAIIIGLQSIYRQKTDWKLIGGFFLAAIVCNVLIYDLPRTSFLHRFLYQLPLCLVQLLMIRVIYRSGMPRLVDKLMMALAIFSCLHYLSKAFLIAWPGSDMRPEIEANMLHVLVSLSIGVFVQVARGLLLLLSTVSHMVGRPASNQKSMSFLRFIIVAVLIAMFPEYWCVRARAFITR